MNGYTHAKKLGLSLLFAFLFIIYVPLACLVGTEEKNDADCCIQANNHAQAQADDGKSCEICGHSEELFSEIV